MSRNLNLTPAALRALSKLDRSVHIVNGRPLRRAAGVGSVNRSTTRPIPGRLAAGTLGLERCDLRAAGRIPIVRVDGRLVFLRIASNVKVGKRHLYMKRQQTSEPGPEDSATELQSSKSFNHRLREPLFPVDIGMRVVGSRIFGLEARRVCFGANRCVKVDKFVARRANPLVQCEAYAFSVRVGQEVGREWSDGGEDGRVEMIRCASLAKEGRALQARRSGTRWEKSGAEGDPRPAS